MTLSDLTRWAGIALAVWLVAVIAAGLSGCAHQGHVRAVNVAAVTLETTASTLLSEYERGRPDDVEEARAYAEKWTPVVHALSAAYAAHDAWRLSLDGDEAGIIAAAAKAREALCELQRVARELSTIAVCRSQGGEDAACSGGSFRVVTA